MLCALTVQSLFAVLAAVDVWTFRLAPNPAGWDHFRQSPGHPYIKTPQCKCLSGEITGIWVSNIEILRMCGNQLRERWKDLRVTVYCHMALTRKHQARDTHITLIRLLKLGPVITALWKDEAERPCSKGKSGLQGEFRANMGKLAKPCLRIKSKKRWDEAQCRAIA